MTPWDKLVSPRDLFCHILFHVVTFIINSQEFIRIPRNFFKFLGISQNF